MLQLSWISQCSNMTLCKFIKKNTKMCTVTYKVDNRSWWCFPYGLCMILLDTVYSCCFPPGLRMYLPGKVYIQLQYHCQHRFHWGKFYILCRKCIFHLILNSGPHHRLSYEDKQWKLLLCWHRFNLQIKQRIWH